MNFMIFINEILHKGQNLQTIVDPKAFGNIGRYINHSCDPNLFMFPVRIGSEIPHLALFARRNIVQNEELTFDYEDVPKGQRELKYNSERSKCFCGSKNCRQFLPFSPNFTL